MQSQQVNFDKIWKYLKKYDTIVGLFLFRDSTNKKSLKEHFYGLTVPTNVFVVFIIAVSTLIMTNFELMSIILTASILSIMFGLYAGLVKMFWNKAELKDLFQWCANLYDVQKKFHKEIQQTATTRLMTTEKWYLIIMKWMPLILYMDALGVTFGYALVGIFLPESIYPKFSPPLPYYLPFKHQKTWIAFFTTVAAQALVSFHAMSFTIFLFGILFCLVMHILTYLNIIYEFIRRIKQELKRNIKDDEELQKQNSSLQMEVLAAVNEKSRDNSNQIPFEESMQVLTDMICDVNLMVSSVGRLFSGFFLLCEIASLGNLFITGLIFTVLKQQYFFAIGLTCVCVLFFIDCYINEKILEKFENIKDALYNIPWYGLDIKQRKMLLIAMNCDQIQKGFTAAGIHNLTIERFGIIVKAGYTNMLVLKDLVQ